MTMNQAELDDFLTFYYQRRSPARATEALAFAATTAWVTDPSSRPIATYLFRRLAELHPELVAGYRQVHAGADVGPDPDDEAAPITAKSDPSTGAEPGAPSLVGRAILAVVLMLGFYGLAVGVAGTRITHSVSRAQELAADRLAARVAGSRALARGLRAVHGSSTAFPAYLSQELSPVLSAGFRPAGSRPA